MAKDTPETPGVASGPPPFPGTAGSIAEASSNFPGAAGVATETVFTSSSSAPADASVAVNLADLKQLVEAAAAAGVDQGVVDKFAGF